MVTALKHHQHGRFKTLPHIFICMVASKDHPSATTTSAVAANLFKIFV